MDDPSENDVIAGDSIKKKQIKTCLLVQTVFLSLIRN